MARADANQYAISSRGFNNVLANKMLVLIDGRSVYSPLFSGVFWEVQQLMLEDVDRIEVISGPGASLWGANAVNGVLNVICVRQAIPRDCSQRRAGAIASSPARCVGEARSPRPGAIGYTPRLAPAKIPG